MAKIHLKSLSLAKLNNLYNRLNEDGCYRIFTLKINAIEAILKLI